MKIGDFINRYRDENINLIITAPKPDELNVGWKFPFDHPAVRPGVMAGNYTRIFVNKESGDLIEEKIEQALDAQIKEIDKAVALKRLKEG